MGGLIVGILLTALVGPYLIDWNSFRPNFERYASELLGQPVRILGDAELRLLPSPTLTLNNIEVGDTEGRPMATVDQFRVRVDLLSLIGGNVNVSSMTLDRPVVTVTVDDAGRLDWLMRQVADGARDPDAIAFDSITINDGLLHYVDIRTGAEFTFAEITTDLFEGASLAGPWRIRGSTLCSADAVCGEGVRAAFNLASGRVAEDGSLRVTAEVTPLTSGFVGTVRTEGTVQPDGDVLAYGGTLSVSQRDASGAGAVWSLAGGFRLVPQELTLSGFTWETADGRFALTGEATLALGNDTRYSVTAQSRQIDLDRIAGDNGPTTMAAAASDVWHWLAGLTVPGIPGDVSVTIPSVIASGSVLQEIGVTLATGESGWLISRLRVGLPGATELVLTDGALRLGDAPALTGTISITSDRPTALATWWHGADLPANPMPRLTVSGELSVAETAASLHDLVLNIGEDAIRGAVDWTAATQEGALGVSSLSLRTSTFDFDNLLSLGRLLLGTDYAFTAMRSRYSVGFHADELRIDDVRATNVDASFIAGPAGINMGNLAIADLDGAHITLAGDLVSRPDDVPGGNVTLTIEADRLAGAVALLDRFAPATPLSDWLHEHGDTLAPLNLEIIARGTGAEVADRFEINGTANGTTIRAEASFRRGVADWAVGEANIVAELDAPDAAAFVRQLGLFEPASELAGPIAIDVSATGVPAGGMTTHFRLATDTALIVADGTYQTDGISEQTYDGAVAVTGDVAPLAGLLGVALPDPGDEAPAVVNADLAMTDGAITIEIAESSSLGGRSVGGNLRLAADGDRWTLSGGLDVDQVDVGWLTAWALGGRALPPASGDAPWAALPFGGAPVASPDVDLGLNIGQLVVAEGLGVDNATVELSLGATSARINLVAGSLGAGQVGARLGVVFQDDRAVVDGQLFLADVPLETLIWSRDDRPAATGRIGTFSVDFSAAGRSAAELVASLSGSGILEIGQGMLGYMSPDAFDRIQVMVDGGAQFTEEVDLRAAFTDFLNAGGLAFDQLQLSFTLAGGVIAPEGFITVEDGGLHASGSGTIDLNTLTVDSNWLLTGTGPVGDGPQPQARIAFTGPLSAPMRQVNVAALQSYLAAQRSRATDIERLEAELLERQRFQRMIARIAADREAEIVEPEPPPPPPGLFLPLGDAP